jgi:molybdate transport system regulatory protein
LSWLAKDNLAFGNLAANIAISKNEKHLSMSARFEFRLHIVVGEALVIDPRKIELLESIVDTGSMAASARELGMSYSHAWKQIDQTNQCLVEPAVKKAHGGLRGGGAVVTSPGRRLIELYRALERCAYKAGTKDMRSLGRLLAQ